MDITNIQYKIFKLEEYILHSRVAGYISEIVKVTVFK